ncbi:RsfA family transcriptional regulator [Paenibacillus sp. YYML68]|uniref:RsfA family transcriptional regulator n=1 Tax=Paenibacillus sp. YYML68 TaxID=2909250 RepID=UPI00248F4E21|nr:RsfA family transcriptional regulator [Paenibacillus sp. YYML68]
MTAIRQDAWSEEDDLILADVTLRHIREGSTQLSAFEEVGEKIGRTAAACGFRWNSFVRKKYESSIQIAKAQRQKRSQQRKHAAAFATVSSTVTASETATVRTDGIVEELSIEAIIRFLRQWKGSYQEMVRHQQQLEKELDEKQEELERLRQQNEELSKRVNHVSSDYRVVNDDYKALIQMLDRARKLAILDEQEQEEKSRFKIDEHGNLEAIE